MHKRSRRIRRTLLGANRDFGHNRGGKAMKIHSFYDSARMLCVDCSECTRGGNGSDPSKCSCGWKHKKGGRGSCYSGTLMQGITVPESTKILTRRH